MDGGAKGVKIQLSGRLGGSEMARSEKGMARVDPALARCGRKIDYGFTEAKTAQGQHRDQGVGQPGRLSERRRTSTDAH